MNSKTKPIKEFLQELGSLGDYKREHLYPKLLQRRAAMIDWQFTLHAEEGVRAAPRPLPEKEEESSPDPGEILSFRVSSLEPPLHTVLFPEGLGELESFAQRAAQLSCPCCLAPLPDDSTSPGLDPSTVSALSAKEEGHLVLGNRVVMPTPAELAKNSVLIARDYFELSAIHRVILDDHLVDVGGGEPALDLPLASFALRYPEVTSVASVLAVTKFLDPNGGINPLILEAISSPINHANLWFFQSRAERGECLLRAGGDILCPSCGERFSPTARRKTFSGTPLEFLTQLKIEKLHGLISNGIYSALSTHGAHLLSLDTVLSVCSADQIFTLYLSGRLRRVSSPIAIDTQLSAVIPEQIRRALSAEVPHIEWMDELQCSESELISPLQSDSLHSPHAPLSIISSSEKISVDDQMHLFLKSYAPSSTESLFTASGIAKILGRYCASQKHARLQGFTERDFYPENTPHRCPVCSGAGSFAPTKGSPELRCECSLCKGVRFSEEISSFPLLGTTLGAIMKQNAVELLPLSEVEDELQRILQRMTAMGLGSIPLATPLVQLELSEAFRLYFVTENFKKAQKRGSVAQKTPQHWAFLLEGLYGETLETAAKFLYDHAASSQRELKIMSASIRR